MIAWNPPLSQLQILGYQVLLDHSLYTTLRADERTRALIENINMNERFHRVSIRTITQRGLSRDQECTLLLAMLGNNINNNETSYAPNDLRIDRITQTSAVISWWPASNDLVHKLFVNDVDVQTLKAGVYRFKLSGLTPNSLHKVTIRAKPNITVSNPQSLSTSIEFRTTSFGKIYYSIDFLIVIIICDYQHLDESIEPPKRVQVIAGPQANTLLISWEQPSSSVSNARGYRIFVDGRQLQDINNPSSKKNCISIG